MIRSTLMILLAAVLVALSPTSATALSTGGALSVSDSSPGVNEEFTAVVEAGTCKVVRLTVEAPRGAVTIDGKSVLKSTKRVTGDTVSFAIVFSQEGTYRLVSECVPAATDDEGYALNDGAGAAEVVVEGDVIAPAEGEVPRPGALPSTGADLATTLLAGAGVVLVLGGGALLLSRRRRSAG